MLIKIIIIALLLTGYAYPQSSMTRRVFSRPAIKDFVSPKKKAFFAPQRFDIYTKVVNFNETEEVVSYTPGGERITRSHSKRRVATRVDTTAQLDDGLATIKLNSRERTNRITSPSGGQIPVIQVTAKGVDTVLASYKADIVTVKEEQYIKITSSDNTDTSTVYITMIVR